MNECPQCGGHVSPGQLFCGSCGAELQQGQQNDTAACESEVAVPAMPSEKNPPAVTQISYRSIDVGGTSTSPDNDISEAEPEAAKQAHTTGGHKPAIKQLEGGTLLNNRYEIVRRIGGGGMGAVYLAKDRNLGDAPRAVKEMVESHLDESQHEKAIGDFKRESLLLTSLEHPSIPTIYDYFYDNQWNRFYLVMKYISGGDLASRLRSSGGGKIDEKTVCDWGMQLADVLDYLHTRPKP